MPLGNAWSFLSQVMLRPVVGRHETAGRKVRTTAGYSQPSHPIDINYELEPEYLKAAVEVSRS
jgi:hypothetical protein